VVVVKKKPGESDEKLIARFKKEVLEEQIVQRARDKKEHKPKSEERKEKKYRIKHLRELERKRSKK
jgi:hypothetical protein